MHKWLSKHGWVNDHPGVGSRAMSYLAFFFIPPCLEMAYLEWLVMKPDESGEPNPGMALAALPGVAFILAGMVSWAVLGESSLVPGAASLIGFTIFVATTAIRIVGGRRRTT